MASATKTPLSGDAGILARLSGPDLDKLPPEVAKALLEFRFDGVDLGRIHDLVVRNQDDALTPAEQADLESYLRVGAFLDLMHAKARRSLRVRV